MLAESMELAGQDATEIRQMIAELEQQRGRPRGRQGVSAEQQGVPPREPEDEFVARKMAESPRQGPGPCAICGKQAEELHSGTCPGCFRSWVLSTRRRS